MVAFVAPHFLLSSSTQQSYVTEFFNALEPYADFLQMEELFTAFRSYAFSSQPQPFVSIPVATFFKHTKSVKVDEEHEPFNVEITSKLHFDVDVQDAATVALYALHYAVDRSFIDFVKQQAISNTKNRIIKNRSAIIAAANKMTGSFPEIEYQRFLIFLDDVVFEQERLINLRSKDLGKVILYWLFVEALLFAQDVSKSSMPAYSLLSLNTLKTLWAGFDINDLVSMLLSPEAVEDPIKISSDFHVRPRDIVSLLVGLNIVPLPNELFVSPTASTFSDYINSLLGTKIPYLSSAQIGTLKRIISLAAYICSFANEIYFTAIKSIHAHPIEFITILDDLGTTDTNQLEEAQKKLERLITRYFNNDINTLIKAKNGYVFRIISLLTAVENLPALAKIQSMLASAVVSLF